MPKSLRVLIAEDDEPAATLIEELLAGLGYRVVGRAINGFQAVAMTESLRPDVVLMDIRMPDMDGIEAARRIVKLRPTPVVVLSSDDNPRLVERASDAGVGAYLIKSADPDAIDRAITISMARFRDMMEMARLNAELERNKEEREKLIAELQEALAKVKTLRGLLPICASCKKIRDDKGYWQQIEEYVRQHSDARFSHGLCPECAKKLYGDYR